MNRLKQLETIGFGRLFSEIMRLGDSCWGISLVLTNQWEKDIYDSWGYP